VIEVQVPTRLADGSDTVWKIEATEEPPWAMTLRAGDGRTWSAQADDMFAAFQEVRRATDAEGVKLCVNGARRDTYPSGMSRDMWGGLALYVLPAGKGLNKLWSRLRRKDLVFIFDPAPCDVIGTVTEQEKYFKKWAGAGR
jgi:hypothetical protein